MISAIMQMIEVNEFSVSDYGNEWSECFQLLVNDRECKLLAHDLNENASDWGEWNPWMKLM